MLYPLSYEGLQAWKLSRRSMGLTWVMLIYRVLGGQVTSVTAGDLSRPWHGARSWWLRW
jgi:hypothetical protein